MCFVCFVFFVVDLLRLLDRGYAWPMPYWINSPDVEIPAWKLPFAKAVRHRLSELTTFYLHRYDQFHGDSFADSAWPGEINTFNKYSLLITPAANSPVVTHIFFGLRSRIRVVHDPFRRRRSQARHLCRVARQPKLLFFPKGPFTGLVQWLQPLPLAKASLSGTPVNGRRG